MDMRRTPIAILLAMCTALVVVAQQPDSHASERPGDRFHTVTIEADRFERLDNDRAVIFIGNVVTRRYNFLAYADRVEVYLDATGRLVSSVSMRNVRVTTSDCRKGTAKRADYREFDERIVLSGNARLRPDEGFVRGEDIFIYLPRRMAGVTGDCVPAGFGTNEPSRGAFNSESGS